MICSNARFKVADNSGARTVRLIKVPGQKGFNLDIGDIVRVSVLEADPKSVIKKGSLHLALVCSLKANRSRANGSLIRFSKNVVILLGDKNAMVGTRILVPIANEIRVKFPEIASKAKEVY
jgi:large subunit ribosomal protein L14